MLPTEAICQHCGRNATQTQFSKHNKCQACAARERRGTPYTPLKPGKNLRNTCQCGNYKALTAPWCKECGLKKTCQICGHGFTATSLKQKYCTSAECKSKQQRIYDTERRGGNPDNRPCLTCGKAIPSWKREGTRFCCRNCNQKHYRLEAKLKARNELPAKVCEECGKEFPSSRKRIAVTCSTECATARKTKYMMARYWAGKPPKHEPCAHCGGKIPEQKRRGVRFCSGLCAKQDEYRRNREATRQRNRDRQKPCRRCGVLIAAGRRAYCSDACQTATNNELYKGRRRYRDASFPEQPIRYDLAPGLARFMASRPGGAEARRFIRDNKMRVGK